MTATTIPGDMAAHRQRGMKQTGLRGDAWGIAPDDDHKAGGGYHCGLKDCQNIGKFHLPAVAHVGSATEDYSVRQYRDRIVGGNEASAEDIGDNWPNGGRAAWLRFNNILISQLRAGDPELAALRAVNFSPDGTQRKRYDSLHPEQGVIPSTDSVTIHTHLEYWRDTTGTALRSRAFTRVEAIIAAAIANKPFHPGEEDDEMGQTFNDTVPSYEELEGRAYTFSPGLVGGGLADPRDTWVSFGADTFGAKFAIRAMQSNGVLGKDGNVGWSPVFDTENVVIASGERKSVQLKQGTAWVSVAHMVIDEADGGKVVLPNPDKDLGPEWAGTIAVLIERGAVAR